MRFGIPAQKPARGEMRPLGCPERIRGSNLARSTEPLLSLPIQAGSASRHVDQIHLYLFTADCVPVQRSGTVSAISPSRSARSDYEYFIYERSAIHHLAQLESIVRGAAN